MACCPRRSRRPAQRTLPDRARGNGAEAALASQRRVRTARTLLEVCAALDGRKSLPLAIALRLPAGTGPDMADVRGQAQARRALEVAAAGSPPPAAGRAAGLRQDPARLAPVGMLPKPAKPKRWKARRSSSVSGRGLDPARWRERPFRSPHHTASAVALVGGGAEPRPGEISLAHHGVLFLDELPEWGRRALEVLREPLESGMRHHFPRGAPKRIPCALPAGRGDESLPLRLGRRPVVALPVQRRNDRPLSGTHFRTVAGAHRPAYRSAAAATRLLRRDAAAGECSATVRERVHAARELQQLRGKPNARWIKPRPCMRVLVDERQRPAGTRRSRPCNCRRARMHRILRVARTIADLAGSEAIRTPHLTEAIGYRRLERGLPRAAA